MREDELPDDAMLINCRDIYDGWSIALMPDGRYINRWSPLEHPARYAKTEEAIKKFEQNKKGE